MSADDRRRGRIRGGLPYAVAAVSCLLILTVMYTASSPEVPASATAPVLPPGVRVVDEQGSCGSGSCSRVLTLAGAPGMTPDDIVRALGPEIDTCRPNGFLDLKPRCTEVRRSGDRVMVSVSMNEFW